MFFQSPTPPPSGGGSSGGVTDADLKRMEDRIVNAIQTGFKNAKLDKPTTTTTTTGRDDGYFGRRSSGGDTSTKSEIEQDIFSPGKMLTNMQSKILAPLYAAGKDLSLEMSKALTSLQQDATNVFVQFGKGREASAGISQALGEAKYSIMEMGGSASQAFITLTELYDTTNKTSLLSAQYVDDLYAASKVTGTQVKELAGKFEAVGSSISSVSKTMMDVVDYAASVGLSVQAVSKQVIQNFEKLNTYNFEGGVKGLTRMAAQATMLKMDMSKTLALADDLLSPEKAIDMAAGLQRLGVSTSALIDPLRLMDMAQNDPEQLQNEIVNLTKQYTYFNEETKKTEILPGAQRYLRELAPILGLSTQELANMAVQSGTIERKLSEIRMPNVIQTEEDKMLFANLAELNKEGKYEIKYFDENAQEQKVLLENMTETQRDAIKASQKIMDDPKEIAKRQLTAAEQTNMLLESLGARLPRELAEKQTTYEIGEATTTAARLFARGTYDTGRETLGISPDDLEKMDETLMGYVKATIESIEKGDDLENVLTGLQKALTGTFEGFTAAANKFAEGIPVDDEGKVDFKRVSEKIGDVFQNAGTSVAKDISTGFNSAIEKELKGTASILGESILKLAQKGLSYLPKEDQNGGIEGGVENGDEDQTMIPDTESVSNGVPITNTNTNNLKGEDVIINNNNNNIHLLGKDTALVDGNGMMAGTDLMGLKDRFGDMSMDLSKSLLSGVEELKSGFRSILETSPTLLSRQTETGIEPKLLSDNLNITLNPELVPEFAKIYKEVRDMGQSIPLNFSFEEPKFDFKFNTDENIDSYLDFKKNIESQIIKPNVPTEEHKLKFSADKVDGLDQINEKIDGIKNTKLDIPFEITDKSKDEPITRKVETSLDDNSINEMVKDLFSEKRMNVGFNFENKEDFEKLSKEFEDLTKEKKIKVSQDEFKSNIPTEQTLKVIPEQDEFKSNVPEEQTSHLKLQFNKEETDNIFKEVGDKFKDPLKLTFEQDKFESIIPTEQTLKVKPEEEKFESKIPQEQSFKLNYEFSNKTDFDNVIKELDQTKETHKIKFEQEKFEPTIPTEQTLKVKPEQEEFKSNIPQEQSFKLNYDFSNKTDFEQVIKDLDQFKETRKIKIEQDKFESTVPTEQVLKVKPEQEEFKSNIPQEQSFTLNYEFANKTDFDKVIGELDKTKEPYKLKFEQEEFESNIPDNQIIKVKTEQEEFKTNVPQEQSFKLNYEFVNKTDFDKVIGELDKTKETHKIKFEQEEFESKVPTEQLLKIKPEQEKFESTIPTEQTFKLNYDFANKTDFDKVIKDLDQFKDPLKLTFDQEKFESTVPTEQVLKVKPEQEEFKSNIPQEQSFTLNYEFSNKTDFDNVIKELDKTKETHKIKFEQEEFEPSIPESQTIKVKPEQEKFESTIPTEQTFKLNYDFVNKTDFDKVIGELDKTKEPYKLKFESDKFESNIPDSQTIKVKTEQEEFKSVIPKEESSLVKLHIDRERIDNVFKDIDDKFKDPQKIKIEQEKFESTIPTEQKLKVTPIQEEFKSNIPQDQSFKLSYDFTNKTDFNQVIKDLDQFKETQKIKFEQEKFEPQLPEEYKLNLNYNFVNQEETESLIGKISSDKEINLMPNESSLSKMDESLTTMLGKDFTVNTKLDETKLDNTMLPDLEQKISFKKPSDDEMTMLKQQFEKNVESFNLSYTPKPIGVTTENLNENTITSNTTPTTEENPLMSSLVDEQSLLNTKLVDLLSTTFKTTPANNLIGFETNKVENESTSILRAQLSENLTTNTLLEKMVINTSKEINPISVIPATMPRQEIPNTNNLTTSVTSNNKMEFGELKIVHQININSGNVDPSVVGQAFTQLTKDPSFVKTLENKIKDLQGGMGQQTQMNPLSA